MLLRKFFLVFLLCLISSSCMRDVGNSFLYNVSHSQEILTIDINDIQLIDVEDVLLGSSLGFQILDTFIVASSESENMGKMHLSKEISYSELCAPNCRESFKYSLEADVSYFEALLSDIYVSHSSVNCQEVLIRRLSNESERVRIGIGDCSNASESISWFANKGTALVGVKIHSDIPCDTFFVSYKSIVNSFNHHYLGNTDRRIQYNVDNRAEIVSVSDVLDKESEYAIEGIIFRGSFSCKNCGIRIETKSRTISQLPK